MHDQSVESEASLIHYVTDIAVMDHGVANDVASWVTEKFSPGWTMTHEPCHRRVEAGFGSLFTS